MANTEEKTRDLHPASATEPTGKQPGEVGEWLTSIGMEHCADLFKENRVEFPHLQGLTDADLQSIGIMALGDRKAILEGVAAQQRKNLEAAETEEEEPLDAFGTLLFVAGILLTCAWTFYATVLDGQSFLQGAGGGVVLWLMFYGYLLPAAIAFRKRHRFRWFILLVNLFFGFTGIVWLILLGYSIGMFGSGACRDTENVVGRD